MPDRFDKPLFYAEISWRKLEFQTGTMKENWYSKLGRICWLMADEW